jgi:hypothetical protein
VSGGRFDASFIERLLEKIHNIMIINEKLVPGRGI